MKQLTMLANCIFDTDDEVAVLDFDACWLDSQEWCCDHKCLGGCNLLQALDVLHMGFDTLKLRALHATSTPLIWA
jgi:hypothetical protein